MVKLYASRMKTNHVNKKVISPSPSFAAPELPRDLYYVAKSDWSFNWNRRQVLKKILDASIRTKN